MTALRNIRMLARYAAWANRLLFQTLSSLPEGELTRTRHIVFGNILRTLNHVYVIDLVWQAHLEGRAHGFTTRNPETHPTFGELRAAQKQIDEWYIGYADDLSEPVCDEIVNFVFVGGGSGSMSRGDILLHVVNHTTYHRGHIADMIYQIPASPPTTDLPVFLRDVPLALALTTP
jgi:uncharacterized damage-inducible protein DinB